MEVLLTKHRSEKGQSTIEFITTFTAAVGFIFLFLKMAMNYTDGYMVHHATYLASRAYLVSDEDRVDLGEGDARALAKAKLVFDSYLPSGLVNGVAGGMLKENSPDPAKTKHHAFVGLWLKYGGTFSIGFVGGKSAVRFISESFLGREPTRSEVRNQSCEAIKSLGLTSCSVHTTLEDNGG